MIASALLTALALSVTFVAARAILRRRIVFLLGRHGPELAPGVLASVWLAAAFLGQRSGSIAGMTWVSAVVMAGLAVWARRGFDLQRGRRHARWTPIDVAIVGVASFVLFFAERWDFACHEVIVGQLLHGNLPPSALNDPRAPLVYHAIYDLVVAVIMTVLPIDLEPAMAIASTACVALTVANLRSITRRLFGRRSVSAQLGRVLFAFGFGPTFLRYLIDGRATDPLHGSTAQVYLDIILRRPAGLAIAFFTLAIALLLPLYRGRADRRPLKGTNRPLPASAGQRRRTTRALVASLPTFVLLPLVAEETLVLAAVFVAPLVLLRRVPWPLVATLVVATVSGAWQSGVMHAVFGQAGTMAAPHPHLSWPPTLPTWQAMDHGAGLGTRHGLFFVAGELGPVFAGGLIWALAGGAGGRGRALAAVFGAGLVVPLFVQPTGWPKSDLDRFLFFGTPLVFMVSAGLVDWLAARIGSARRRRGTPAAAIALGAFACVTPLVFPGGIVLANLRGSFERHALGGGLARRLQAVKPRQVVLTTRERAHDLLCAGFLVLAPFETSSVGTVTDQRFDDYVRAHADRADWLFLPKNDARVAGQSAEAQDGDFVLVRVNRAAVGAQAAGAAIAGGGER